MLSRRVLSLALFAGSVALLLTLCRSDRLEVDVPAGSAPSSPAETRTQAAPAEAMLREPVEVAVAPPRAPDTHASRPAGSLLLLPLEPVAAQGPDETQLFRQVTYVRDFDVELAAAASFVDNPEPWRIAPPSLRLDGSFGRAPISIELPTVKRDPASGR